MSDTQKIKTPEDSAQDGKKPMGGGCGSKCGCN
jgi:hypothetical protein